MAHTWPLARSPSDHLQSGPDVLSGVWSLTELSRRLISNPGHLMDGNIFYPFANTLAVLDHQFASALSAVPLVVAGAGGAFIYNAVILSTFFLSGVFTYLLVRRLTGSVAAGLVSGCAYAFSAYRGYHLPQSHLLATQWLPLALLMMHRYLERPTWRRWGALAAATLLVALSSWHIAVVGAVGLALVALWTMAADLGKVRQRAAGLLLVAVLCGAALLPMARSYIAMGNQWPPRTGEGRETITTLVNLSANLVGLVAPQAGSRTPYAPLLSRFAHSQPGVFPGLVLIALAVPALAMLCRGKSPPATMRMKVLRWSLWSSALLVVVATGAAAVGWESVVALLRPLAPFVLFGLALAVAGLVLAHRAGKADPEVALVITYAALAAGGALLALGPRVSLGSVDVGSGLWRFDLLPVRLMIRAPERLSLLLALGMAVLAGMGLAQLLKRCSPKTRFTLTAVVLVVLNADLAFSMPPLRRVPPPSEVERWLAESPDEGAVIDYPLFQTNRWNVYASQQYGRRIVNGRGYVWPLQFRDLEDLPDLSSEQVALLWEYFHPRFVIVRVGIYEPAERARVLDAIEAQADALRPRAQSGWDLVYELVDRGRGAELYRTWPLSALQDKRGLRLEGAVTAGRDDTVPELVVSLNGHTLLEAVGADAEAPTPRLVPFDADHLIPGLNTFVIRAGYRFAETAAAHPIGTTGARLAADVAVVSAADRSTVVVNGRRLRVDKGYLLVVLDAATGAITNTGAFNVSWYPEDSEALVAFVRDVPAGSPVVVASEFDVSRQLTASVVEALGELGLQADLRGQLGAAHAAIGVKGAPPGSGLEATDPETATIELGQPDLRVVQLASLQLR